MAWQNYVGTEFQGFIDNPIDVTKAFETKYSLHIKSEKR